MKAEDHKSKKFTQYPFQQPFTLALHQKTDPNQKKEDSRVPDGYRMGWMVDSNAPVVDICTQIPEGAELYAAENAMGDELTVCDELSFEGSKIHKGKVRCVVVPVK